MDTVPLCRLKTVLDDAGFDSVDLRVLREAGMLPAGKLGRDGIGSAQITPRHTATVLLGLASLAWSGLNEAPAEAQRLAEFQRLPRRDIPLLDILPGEIASAGHSMSPASWRFSQRTVVRERGGEAPVRFVAADVPVGDVLAIRETVLDGALIAAVGRLFAATAGKRAA